MAEPQTPDRFGAALARLESLCGFAGGEQAFVFQILAVMAGVTAARAAAAEPRGAVPAAASVAAIGGALGGGGGAFRDGAGPGLCAECAQPFCAGGDDPLQ